MSRQKIRIIGRRRSHRQNLTGLRVHCHHSALTALQSAIRNILKLRINRQLHASALRRRTTKQLRHTVVELAVARAGKFLIQCSFQARRAINRGEITRQSRILKRVVIHAGSCTHRRISPTKQSPYHQPRSNRVPNRNCRRALENSTDYSSESSNRRTEYS